MRLELDFVREPNAHVTRWIDETHRERCVGKFERANIGKSRYKRCYFHTGPGSIESRKRGVDINDWDTRFTRMKLVRYWI